MFCLALAASYALWQIWSYHNHYKKLATPLAAFTVAEQEGNRSPLTIVEFMHYDCAYCKDTHTVLLDYAKSTPEIRLVTRPVPFEGGGAQIAAERALAAGLQGKFWEMDSALTEHRAPMDEKFYRESAALYNIDYDRMVADSQGEEVKKMATEITGSSEFSYEFLDEHFAAGYRSDLQRRNLFLFFSSLALIIACLGLFALSFKLVLSKSKETGIRKVFGSTTRDLLIRYSISCTVHAFIGLVVSIPIVYYYGNSWLDNFAYKKEIGISVFVISIIIVYSISFLTVLFNSYKAARLNPIESLRVRE